MENILSINLETSTAPIIQEVRGRDYIEYGTEDWRNLYPQFLIDLYYNSSTHAAIINATAEMIAGEDLICVDDDVNLDAFVRLKKFLRHANSKETLHQIIKKVAFDFKLQGAYAIHVVWNRERTEIAEIYHVPVERVRAGRPNEFGKVDTYFISADWANTRVHKPYPIAAFNVNDRTAGSQLIYTGAYSPNMDVYHTPDYIAANNWALVDQRVAEFHLNNIENGFSGSYFISFANGVPTQEERFQIEQSLTDKFSGAKNSGKFVLTFSDDRTRTPEITPISVSDADKQYLALQELLVQNILTGHRVTSKTLMGIDSTNGFSSNTDELINAANFYLNTVVRPFQLNILDTLGTIFSVNNIDLPVEFVQLKPITVQFDSKTVREVMTTDEIRESLGLEPLGDENTVEQDVKFSKVGMIDGEPVFSTIEEAEEHAKTIGCEGYHKHEHEGETVYMACKGHEEATELSKFIAEFGEEIPEEWQVIDDEIVDGEHQDFDFEDELNKIANEKFDFVSTGRANPNVRSEQDGLNKAGDKFFKVRYIYTKNNSVPGDGKTRDFCSTMVNANKVYRKEDILRMSQIPVNPGFGPRGAATYSIWLYKGGPICHHYWKRRIYQAPASDEGFVVYPDNITTDKIITATKARSEGFTIKRNDSLVARAPKTMKNEGFLNPR
tara:strand:+ start:131 stop:2134 length:2004 start_codon:yes stop_codon:yes gene_type:complete